MLVNKVTEFVDDLRCKKLHLVHDHGIIKLSRIGIQEVFDKLAVCDQTNAGTDDTLTIPVLALRFQKSDFLALFQIILPHHQRIGSFGTAHCTIPEYQFCHANSPIPCADILHTSAPHCLYDVGLPFQKTETYAPHG